MINIAISLGVGVGLGTEELKDYVEPRYRQYFDGDYIVLEVETPGVEKENITVELLDDITVRVRAVSGDRKYLLVKKLPMPVKTQGAVANYRSGLLIVKLPLKGGTRIRIE